MFEGVICMSINDFYMCDEDNVFNILNSLYEELTPDKATYPDAEDIDVALEWVEEVDYQDLIDTNLDDSMTEGYDSDKIDFQRGDILLASVYQPGENINRYHQVRPFLVVYANANRAYGFQLTSSRPVSFQKYLVPISDYRECGLEKPCGFMLNMVRGVDISRLVYRIGHITDSQKQSILSKLFEIKDNSNGLYDDCVFRDRIDITIENIERIHT